MKKILVLFSALWAVVAPVLAEPQIPAPASNGFGVIALTSSTAIRLVPGPSTAPPFMCNSIFIQSLAGNTAVVYVLNAPVNVTMSQNGAGTTTVAQLAFSSTQPGGSFTFPSNSSGTTNTGGTDMRLWGVQGTTGDSVLATCDSRQ